ncbi:unnamed protein product [Gongylonema pulchrum]|uniref:Tubulin-specific chaperone A n=1 Tax=Gongylonema pulchrum TaxID=637853 RepID=A0A183ECW3_9BILA|nr:unnamed protein product [Gongylonema pulchrum]
MADCAGALKELTIKTGVVKRLIKELNSYQKEAEKESMKLEAMKAQGDTTDRYAIKKQAEIVEVVLFFLYIYKKNTYKFNGFNIANPITASLHPLFLLLKIVFISDVIG